LRRHRAAAVAEQSGDSSLSCASAHDFKLACPA
jgi:hypothetical protein